VKRSPVAALAAAQRQRAEKAEADCVQLRAALRTLITAGHLFLSGRMPGDSSVVVFRKDVDELSNALTAADGALSGGDQ
jgi:hypothetical protein